jgi:hypothetical protein
MSRRFAVVTPTHLTYYLRQADALSLVELERAIRTGPRSIQLLPIGTVIAAVRTGHYIPDKLPPLEVPNCHFQPPQSDQWRAQHGVMRVLTA